MAPPPADRVGERAGPARDMSAVASSRSHERRCVSRSAFRSGSARGLPVTCRRWHHRDLMKGGVCPGRRFLPVGVPFPPGRRSRSAFPPQVRGNVPTLTTIECRPYSPHGVDQACAYEPGKQRRRQGAGTDAVPSANKPGVRVGSSLVGGASAVIIGWRETTLDVDLKLDPEPPGVFEAIALAKDALAINVELAAQASSPRHSRIGKIAVPSSRCGDARPRLDRSRSPARVP